MTTTTRNPLAERHQLRADIQAARVAHDTLRGEAARLEAEVKAARDEAFKCEMDAVVGVEGAAEKRDAAEDRAEAAEAAAEAKLRGVQAAAEVIKIRQAQLEALHDDPEAFPMFVREAEAATAGAVSDLRALRSQLAQASQSWAKATAMWSALNAPLRHRLEAANEAEGRYSDVAREAACPPFPFALPSDLRDAAPRPAGVKRVQHPAP